MDNEQTRCVEACESHPAHTEVLNLLSKHGYEAYFVGGFVRDTLLGRESKDVDIVTAATPTQIKDIFFDASLVGAHFGVSIVPYGGETIEVATFRLDGAYKDSRHPDSVAFTYDLREDLERRDFTINALVMDATGRVYDYVGGKADLKNKIISTIGPPDQCFKEDSLRMLRAIRFSCQLGFTIAERTLQGVVLNAHLIQAISAERIAQELRLILTSGRAAEGVELLRTTGLLCFFLPEIEGLVGVRQNAKHHPEGDVYTHTLAVLRQLEPGCSVTLALAALLHDVGKPATYGEKDGEPTFYGHDDVGEVIAGCILNRLRFSGEETTIVRGHVKQHMQFRNVETLRKSKLLRFIRHPHFPELLALHKIDAIAGSGNMHHAKFAEDILASVPEEVLRPARLITGLDLLEMGLTPGPSFKVILEEVETKQLEGHLNSRETALVFAQQLADSLSDSPNGLL